MIKFKQFAPALGAFFVLGLSLSACGEELGGNTLATVGDTQITKVDFDHWFAVACRGIAAQQNPGAPAACPKPPDFAACVSARKRSVPTPPGEAKPPSDAQFRSQCKSEYVQARDQVVSFLVAAEWLEGEATDRDVIPTEAEVARAFARVKKQAFPKNADYKKFLRESGQSDADVVFRVKLQTIQENLQKSAAGKPPEISSERVEAYYKANEKNFTQPERREVVAVVTEKQGPAKTARKAVEGGMSFGAAAKKYSTDQVSKVNEGRVPPVTRNGIDPALEDAVFEARIGDVVGPVKSRFGYYVFKLVKVTPKKTQTVAEATPGIKQTLIAKTRQRRLDLFLSDFRKKWTRRTTCGEDFVTTECGNSPGAEDTLKRVPPPGAKKLEPLGRPAPQPQQPQQAPPPPQQAPPPQP